MRLKVLSLTLLILSSGVSDERSRQASAPDASLLLAARSAIGGEHHLAALKTVHLAGTLSNRNQYYGIQSGRSEEFTTTPFDIKIMLPDRYVESQITPLSVTYEGFTGDTLLNRRIVRGGQLAKTASPPTMLSSERLLFAQLMLCMFLKTDTALPLTLTGSSEKGLEFLGGDERMALELDLVTHLPRRLRIDVPMRRADGGLTGIIDKVVVEMHDYRQVEDLLLAWRQIVYRNGRKGAERAFTLIELNKPLSDADFAR